MTEKSPADLYDFMRRKRCAIIATANEWGVPEAALIDIAVTTDLEILFETTAETRKYHNLQARSQVALVIGWEDNQTLQCDGIADEPTGAAADPLIAHYLSAFPEKLSHRNWPGNHYFRVRPNWIRFSDYNSPRMVEEYRFPLPDGRKSPAPHFSPWWKEG